jgi:Spy/CpxP family protein refolding chaperone
MKRVLTLTIVLGIVMMFTLLLWAQSQAEPPDYGRRHFCPRSGSGPGWSMGAQTMGPGYGRGMGPGMMGHGWGMGPHHRAWGQMTPEQRQEWKQMRSKFSKDTLQLRQKLVNKQMELQDLWEEEKPDTAKIQSLSDDIADLQLQLEKKRNHFLIQCRNKFGGEGWMCPGMGWGAGY